MKTIYPVFRQILMLIAPNLVHETEREHPCRNTFSNANRHRDPAFAEILYWKRVAHFSAESPAFLRKTQKGCPGRFRNRRIRLLDFSTICLALTCAP
ncbi:MAG: hypothetical protein IK066_10415 [Kiritimatiellae bacterium]|nr:hypothetical protein [Kiritimatiellia bacterium]